jgi:hypothetical protein
MKNHDVLHVASVTQLEPRWVSPVVRKLNLDQEHKTGVYGPGWGGRVRVLSEHDMDAYCGRLKVPTREQYDLAG